MRIAVIGAGLGGLYASSLLAQKGHDVTVFEKNAVTGGRLYGFTQDGFAFDAGPTLLLMPDVLRHAFERLGQRLEDHVALESIDPVYDVYFSPGEKLSLSSDVQKTKSDLSRVDPRDAARYGDYLAESKKHYDAALDFFLQRNVHRLSDFLSVKAAQAFFAVGLSGSYSDHVARFFKNPRIRAALSFQSIYVGGSPAKIPAAYSLIQYVEATQGVWTVKGGLYQIAVALKKIADKKGVRIQTNQTVSEIVVEDGKAKGVRLADGSFFESDVVLCNADLPFAYAHLLSKGQSPVQKRTLDPSCSAFMMYFGVKRKLPLKHHAFLLPEDFAKGMQDLFDAKRLPSDPGIYLCCASKTFPEMAPDGCDGLYVLVPVPNLQAGIDWNQAAPAFRKTVLGKINAWLGLDLEDSDFAFQKIVTPQDWKDRFGLEWGSTFGLSPTLTQSAFFRPQNRDPRIKNLYFVGASTHPGSGIPIVLFSADNVVHRIQSDFP
ncbi:phytoene desaturase [Candidatus Micrarchaeota archaeon]|nr:phytoene desaturase [Candidatus Micrarchaeota archaeon]